MSFVIIPKKDPKKLQNLWAPSLTTVHISLVGWDQGGREPRAQSPEPREPRAEEPRAQSPGSPDHEL